MPVCDVLSKDLDLSKYLGQWVVICNKEIVAHEKDLKKIQSEISSCKTTPTIAKIPKKGVMLF